MSTVQIVFLFIGFLILLAAWMMVSRSNLVHSALWLVVALFGVAVLFVLLESGYLAVIQVLVYIGAIAILMIFAVMLTRGDVESLTHITNRYAGWAAVMAAFLLFGLVIVLGQWPAFQNASPEAIESANPVLDLGMAFVSPDGFTVPFIVASVLLLAAFIGAIYAAFPRKKGE